MGGTVFLPRLLFGMGLLSLMGGARFFKMATSRGAHADNYPPDLSLQNPSSTTKPESSHFPRRFSNNCHQICPRFLWSLCFALGPSAHENLCTPFKNGVSLSLSSMKCLCTTPTGIQCQMLWGFLLPIPDAWVPDLGLRTLTPIGGSL